MVFWLYLLRGSRHCNILFYLPSSTTNEDSIYILFLISFYNLGWWSTRISVQLKIKINRIKTQSLFVIMEYWWWGMSQYFRYGRHFFFFFSLTFSQFMPRIATCNPAGPNSSFSIWSLYIYFSVVFVFARKKSLVNPSVQNMSCWVNG